MKIQPIISKLIAGCPSATEVTLANGVASVGDSQLPLIYVYPAGESSSGSNYDNLVVQTITCRFSLMFAASVGSDSLNTIRDSARTALLGYVIESGYDAIEYESGEILDISASTIWWRDTYMTNRYVRQS